MKSFHHFTFLLMFFLTIACSSQSAKPDLNVVKTVDLQKYMGVWYEISRLPNSFEKGMECVTATYTLLENGKVEVLNQARLISDHSKIKTAKGKAHIPNKDEPAKLKVTFFWPFYGDYWILALDQNYQYVLVGEPSRKYLWVLSRQKTMDSQTYQSLMDIAKKSGFDVDKIQTVKQNCEN